VPERKGSRFRLFEVAYGVDAARTGTGTGSKRWEKKGERQGEDFRRTGTGTSDTEQRHPELLLGRPPSTEVLEVPGAVQ